MTAEFTVLGPVEVRLDGAPIPIGPRQQAILALLLVEANRLVTLDQILERVWGAKRPARPANAVQTQLTLLRRSLAPVPDVTIAWQTAGYRLTIDEATIDLHRFRDLVRQAGNTTDDEQAAEHRAAAVNLWHGDPFAGIDLPWFNATRANLLAEHEATALDHADTLLRLGHFGDLLPNLEARAAQRPLDERLAGQLMLALHGAGRTDEALHRYEDLHNRLTDELGADPSAPLQELHHRIHTNTTDPVPRQLPAPPDAFTGRAQELTAMTKILDNATETGGTVIVSAISGTGGIGKTWLTLRWAHQQRDRFPDGQLFVDLRGFGPENQPMATGTALRGFLDALGVPVAQVPTNLGAQTALLRTLLADKRMLIVLDNAASTEQVLPLLPGGSTNTVLVNSRDRLSGLVTGHGAHRLILDILADAEAHDLLRTRLGTDRIAAEPQAVNELLTYCGGFPLALSIIAGRALSRPDLSLAALATELREHRLLALDDSAGLSSVLSWSYRALTAEQARAFGLFGIAPGPDIDLTAAADLIDRSQPETRLLLRALERASLLHQHIPGRYRLHDLVRAYAREQAGPQTEALRRVIDFYLHSAFAAEDTASMTRTAIALSPPVAGVHPRTFASVEEAMRWFAEEYRNLSAAEQDIATRDWHRLTWQLTWTMSFYRMRDGQLLDNIAALRTGLAATLSLGDAAAEAVARQLLGYALARAGQFDEAHEQLTESIRIAVDIGDIETELVSERNVVVAFELQERYQEAEQHARRALGLSEENGNPLWISVGMINLGWILANQGEFGSARDQAEQALAMHLRQAAQDHTAIGNMLNCLGRIANGMGSYSESIDYCERARAHYALVGNVYGDSETLEDLGHPHRALGQLDKAREAWQAALRICRDQHRPIDAQRIESLLDALPSEESALAFE